MTYKFWMVVDVSEVLYGVVGNRLPNHKAPRFIHGWRSKAEIEAARLAKLYPAGIFVILEAVAIVRNRRTSWSNLTKIDKPKKEFIVSDLQTRDEAMQFDDIPF
ncbi:hypothetical protein P886_3803 [Alteromonadaceae bacterium 2753L.S.0a.02]|nr:hypothetical protein P886_3803 [Alteromonadaceae bacterium 2753L.S.0a.02]